MQNFDFMLTYKIYKNRLLNTLKHISTHLIIKQGPERNWTLVSPTSDNDYSASWTKWMWTFLPSTKRKKQTKEMTSANMSSATGEHIFHHDLNI